ncbi:MAG: ribosome biogenesis GTPase Der, partial [Bacilli bacterium]|nr:ribosome biogenesis GTPase Der [Bacilli bacterium]
MEDRDVVIMLQKSHKPLIVAANKVDDNSFVNMIYDFYNLGVEEVMPISTLHGIGIGNLLDRVMELLPDKKKNEYDDAMIKFCLIGQPNVGKSTLANAIIGEERTIVSEIPGTTRDSIDTLFTRNNQPFVVIDTAGIRKQGKIYENAEKYSVFRAIQAIERCDVAVVVLDGSKPITEQDKRIAGYAREYNRAMIICVNKWDIVQKDDKTMKEFIEKIRNEFLFLEFAPIVFLSAKNNSRIHFLLDEINHVYQNFTRRVPTNLLNDCLLDATLLNQPPMFKGNRLKLSYATQEETMPPSFVLFVNSEKHMHFSYLRYLENQIRATFDFQGAPMKFTLRKKE